MRWVAASQVAAAASTYTQTSRAGRSHQLPACHAARPAAIPPRAPVTRPTHLMAVEPVTSSWAKPRSTSSPPMSAPTAAAATDAVESSQTCVVVAATLTGQATLDS